jgi:hypothetical protein
MGKKSRRKKNNNGGPMVADKFEEILKFELKYRHLGTFSDDPYSMKMRVFSIPLAVQIMRLQKMKLASTARFIISKEPKCAVRTQMPSDQVRSKNLKTAIGMRLAGIYSNGRGMEKAISSYRWSFANGNRPDEGIITISRNFNRFKKCEYTIEVLEGSMDSIRTLREKAKAKTCLIQAYIGFGEFLKAKAANEKRLSIDWQAVMQSGEIEEVLCN